VPDARRHRGAHPDDAKLFAPSAVPTLRRAAADLGWLLDRGYPVRSALALVGDRHALAERQRTAVRRCSCSEAERVSRGAREARVEDVRGATIWIDGFNVLTTIEAALAGGVLLRGRDGALRDMASMHGSYRRVAETGPALDAIEETLEAAGPATCVWWLDAPVSNSGRLATRLRDRARERGLAWSVEVVADPDPTLRDPPEGVIVASADSSVMDGAPHTWQLARETVGRLGTELWVVDLADVCHGAAGDGA
jgi:hypothetical protein